jgi:two-component system, OmpR family, phosphate regulon response regulator PhoB
MQKMNTSILVVEDEPAIQELIAVNLARAGYNVLRADDSETAQRLIHETMPSLAIVDWMLPGKTGIALIRILRAEPATRDLPVIMLTARSGEHDKVLALESGADDYMTKPFSPREMLARVHAMLRRLAPQATSNPTVIGGLHIDPVKYRVTALNQPIALSPTEFRLLHYLMSHPERVHTRTNLLDKVWGMNAFLDERTVDAHVARLRGSLEHTGYHACIETVRGVGYRFMKLDTSDGS